METRKRAVAAGERGSALVLSLVAVLFVSILAAGFLQLVSSVTNRQGSAVDQKHAFYLAEAGLAEAYMGLAVARTGNVGTPAQPAAYGDGLLWVEATTLPGGNVELESTGVYGRGRVTLGLVVEPIERSVAELGIFAATKLTLPSHSLVDSYDSRLGSYASQVGGPTNDKAVVGSNDDVWLKTGDEVRGDVLLGPTGNLTMGNGAVLTGTSSNRAANEVLPPIEVPVLPSKGSLKHSGPVPEVIAPGEVAYDSITIAKNSRMVLTGPLTLVTNDLFMSGGGELVVDATGGPVEIHVTGDLELQTGSTFDTATTGTDSCFIYCSGDAGRVVDLASHAAFEGFVYAPSATVKVASHFELFGGLVVQNLQLASTAKLHLDTALPEMLQDELPTLVAWRVVDIPAAVARDRTHLALGVDPATLPPPARAHEDQWLELDYVDLSGADASYSGWESAFDWTDVLRVVHGTRDGVAFKMEAQQQKAQHQNDGTPPPGGPSDWIADAQIPSGDLLSYLLDVAPLTAGEINEAIERVPPMESQDLEALLQAHYPLAAGTLNLVMTTAPLSTDQVQGVLLDNTPLAPGDLSTAIDYSSLSDAQLRDVLIANSPLKQGTKNTLKTKSPPMNKADYDQVMAAQ